MVVFIGQRAVQGDNVRLPVQGFKIDILHAHIQRGGAWVGIKRQQTHTEAFQNAQRGDADFTGADNAGGFTVHGETG